MIETVIDRYRALQDVKAVGEGAFRTAVRIDDFVVKVPRHAWSLQHSINEYESYRRLVEDAPSHVLSNGWRFPKMWFDGEFVVSEYIEGTPAGLFTDEDGYPLWDDSDLLFYGQGIGLGDTHGGNLIIDAMGDWWVVDLSYHDWEESYSFLSE